MAFARSASAPRATRALFMAGLVLALGLLVYLPGAHAWLHVGGHAETENAAHDKAASPGTTDQDATCAVSLFAHGLPAPILPPELRAPAAIPVVPPSAPLEAPEPKSPDHLHPPGQAPPRAV